MIASIISIRLNNNIINIHKLIEYIIGQQIETNIYN